jgi:hypothetical protein
VVAASVNSLQLDLNGPNASVAGRKSNFFKEITKMRNCAENREPVHVAPRRRQCRAPLCERILAAQGQTIERACPHHS